MPIYNSRYFPESKLAHKYLDGLKGVEIGKVGNGFAVIIDLGGSRE